MQTILSRPEYERQVAETRDARMAWWRDARFGMFVHFGAHTLLGRNEWVMALENWTIPDYEAVARKFRPEPGCTRQWAKLAAEAGMKYMVLTTRHHEGFSLWDSKVNPYNAVAHSGGFDIVKEYVESCHEFGLRVGFYFSLMDWHHPDSWRCAFDPEARARFQGFLVGMLKELLGGTYGKVDILWYDVSRPMESHEGWGSLQMNQMVRSLQPDIIVNNRSKLDEDFSTPEEHLTAAEGKDWEACMTFNRISWGYLDSVQALPYSYNTQGILRMLNTVCESGGNLLLNIGPMPDGSVPPEAIEPLQTTGRWLGAYGDAAVYGRLTPTTVHRANGIGRFSQRGNKVYFWQFIRSNQLIFGGFETKLKSIRLLPSGAPLAFEQNSRQIVVTPPPAEQCDQIANITVFEMEFEDVPVQNRCSAYPQLHVGEVLVE
ncbi:MAG: alpha-L-fucosidase [Anaerolineae bacterium]|nr:alpha-L-fucosidase [Anaerolineae bacterium]